MHIADSDAEGKTNFLSIAKGQENKDLGPAICRLCIWTDVFDQKCTLQ